MFKSFAVHGVKAIMLNGQKHVEECADADAECFGLYGYEADGTCRWLADHPTRQEAEAAQEQFTNNHTEV